MNYLSDFMMTFFYVALDNFMIILLGEGLDGESAAVKLLI